MKTITLPNGYNGHTVECDIIPVVIDGNMAKLQIKNSYMFRWVSLEDYPEILTAIAL